MTLAYEAARATVARFIGAGSPDEIVFVRGATEGINLVAQCGRGRSCKAGDRILLSTLEHHSNIVPWQLVAERVGAQIDVVPLTGDGRIDLDAMAAMMHARAQAGRAGARVERAGRRCSTRRRAADIAHSRRREAAARRVSGGAAVAGRCRRARLRFLRLLGAQALRPDRDRGAVGAARTARRDAAVAGRRGDDRPGVVRQAPPTPRRPRGSRRGRRISSARSGWRRRSIMSRGSGWSASTRTRPRWCG